MTEQKPKYHLKIIVCGTGAVGKTSLIRRYMEGKFNHNYLMTVGMDPSNKMVVIDGIPINLILYDVAGQKRFETLREIFFRGAHGGLLVFDLTRAEETLNELGEWKEQIDQRAEGIPLILIGNKSDLSERITFDRDIIEDEVIPRMEPFKYLETSALLDENVSEAFDELVREILRRQGII